MSSIKFILIGDSEVGKTCLINQYSQKEFIEEHIATLSAGGNDREKRFKDVDVGNKTVKLEILDSVGKEQYRAINKIFMKNAKIAAIVYDMTNQETFDNIKNWYNELKEINNTIEMIGIIANKSDLYEEKVVSKEEGENYAKSINGFFYETSAMDYESVSNAFEDLTKKYVDVEERKKNEELKLEASKSNSGGEGDSTCYIL